MSYGTVVMKIPILFFFTFSSVFLGTNGDVYYVPKFTDSLMSCDNFDNDFLNADDLKLGSLRGDDGDDAAKLSGKIVTSLEIIDDYDIEIDIWKEMELGDEYMYSSRVNFCSSLSQEDAPWSPIMEKLNISSCPVPSSVFEVQGLMISLDSVKDIMSHDFCGEYRIQLSIIDVTDKISCHILEICIVEENDDDE